MTVAVTIFGVVFVVLLAAVNGFGLGYLSGYWVALYGHRNVHLSDEDFRPLGSP